MHLIMVHLRHCLEKAEKEANITPGEGDSCFVNYLPLASVLKNFDSIQDAITKTTPIFDKLREQDGLPPLESYDTAEKGML